MVLPAAYNAGGDTTNILRNAVLTGAYSSLNTWVYYKDNSIPSGLEYGIVRHRCDIDDTDSRAPTTLQPCGTS